MQANGLGNVAQSWIGNGANQAITPSQVEQVLSSSQLSELAAKSGLPPDQLKSGIASILPHLVNSLSPNGSLPEAAQVQGAVGQLQQVTRRPHRPALTTVRAPAQTAPRREVASNTVNDGRMRGRA